MQFADLEITIWRQAQDAYSVETRLNLPNSEAEERSERDMPFRIDLAALQAKGPNWKAYGAYLRDAFLAGPVGAEFQKAREGAGAATLRVRLIIDRSAKELHEIHWETMMDTAADAPLFAGERIVFSRYLHSLDWRPIRTRRKTALKALIVVANPSNVGSIAPGGRPLAPVDVEAELKAAKQALQKLTVPKTLSAPGEATLPKIAAELRKGYDILYIVAHGSVRQLAGGVREAQIYFVNDDNSAAPTVGAALVTEIQSLLERPRLVVLASCQSGGTGADIPELDAAAIAGALGPRLAQAGIPAVMAMRGNVTMDTSLQFYSSFFEELSKDGQIDRAASFARWAVRGRPDFWVPVLYTRLKTGRIWYVPGFGAESKFEHWTALCSYVRSGKFLPIVGPDLSSPIFGDATEIAQEIATAENFPMRVDEGNDLAKVGQFVENNSGPVYVRDKIRAAWVTRAKQRFPEEFASSKTSLEAVDKIVTRMMNDETNGYRILASLNTAGLYINANPDSLLRMALEKAQPARKPVEVMVKWRDERREFDNRLAQTEAPLEHNPATPTLFYVFGHNKKIEPYDPKLDSWVLTEDDFFDFLIRTSKNERLIPPSISERMLVSSLMFLGFTLDDWKFRALFRMIRDKGGSNLLKSIQHVGVQVNPDESTLHDAMRAKKFLETYFKSSTNVHIFWGSATDFLRELEQALLQQTPEETRNEASNEPEFVDSV